MNNNGHINNIINIVIRNEKNTNSNEEEGEHGIFFNKIINEKLKKK